MTSPYLMQPVLSRRERIQQIYERTEQLTILMDSIDGEPYRLEMPLTYTWQDVVNDIASGQIEEPQAIYQRIPDEPEHDVSEAIANAVLDKLIDSGEPIEPSEFIMHYSPAFAQLIAEADQDDEYERRHLQSVSARP